MNHPTRKRYSNNSGRRPNNNRNYSNNRSGGSSSGGAPRPRKNFRALQEKFLNQAKDAMASGDRILAEYYLQHADHYYRMNEEFLAERAEHQEKRNANKREEPNQDDAKKSDSAQDEEDMEDEGPVEDASDFDSTSSSLPAFITAGGKDTKEGAVKVVNLQEWDD